MVNQLSNNFYLKEFTDSNTAARNNIDNTPGETEVINLRRLTRKVLQPLRDMLGCSIHISSGYRCKELNRLVKGSSNSQHLNGEAADIQVFSRDLKEVYLLIKNKIPEYDQLIFEFGQWIHVSLRVQNNRKENLVFEYKNGVKNRRKFIEGEF